uniref:Uncharacterized protein n=1 Tax=Phlebotomus papatasi TaxID=29031 RepID=A0A1B0GPD8_PHLPP
MATMQVDWPQSHTIWVTMREIPMSFPANMFLAKWKIAWRQNGITKIQYL